MNFHEVRYPFRNIVEYLSGYIFKLEALHLAVGLFIIFYVIYAIFKTELLTREKIGLVVLFLWPFTNPAYTYVLSISEFFLIVNFFYLIYERCKFKTGFVFVQFVILCTLILIHFIIINIYFFVFNGEPPILQGDNAGGGLSGDNFFNRFIVIFKVLLIPFLFLSFSKLNSISKISIISRVGATVAALVALVYMVQFIVLIYGRIPYGTFDSAGFGGFPSFGAISVERGHLAKFMAPFLPFLLIDIYLNKRYIPIILYSVMMLFNFSASGYVFFTFSLFITIFICRKEIFNRENVKYIVPVITFSFLIIFIYLWFFSDTLILLFDKIYDFVFSGDETGGRTISLLMQYVNLYPYGFGYGGSTFRTVHSLPEINMGIYTMFTQISIITFLFYLYLLTCSVITIRYSRTVVEKILCGGVLLMPFVFSADILWFVPTYWAPLILVSWFQLNREK
ncbi:hypothetical protein [Yersinia pseudotuberculosis]|uniref:O-unit polymerase n=1 Tax=Yersinia pseudotuberculosis TaxID=633 RepID=D7P8M1_YERPU|nr:hypothetical protein [Yersinia pseudotuberculosis]ADI59445.1 O-unit polymerase [Yersinia pseudotuberculosis]AXY32141.1 hypothetical protein CEQ20_01165 [Yersinia pseudotuberculosis]AYX11814.1 hypothetical protein EGX52_14155 [Yersinia pseudotuberculosis]MBO1564321.1 hypothetical protein [Yersinia pseudotuberculosis]MBO1588206.1 hypothetical protein [Yersinia pseudotuberculosis]